MSRSVSAYRVRSLLGASLLLAFPQLGRADTSWITATGGDWQTVGNWSEGLPTGLIDADFALSNSYTIIDSSAAVSQSVNVSAGDVTFNPGANTIQTGTLAVSAGSLTLNSGTLSTAFIDTTGALSIAGGAITATLGGPIPDSGLLLLGGGGLLQVSAGSVSLDGALAVGDGGTSGDTAYANFSGGNISVGNVVTAGNTVVYVGFDHAGQITQSGTASFSSPGDMLIGSVAGESGTYLMQGGTLSIANAYVGTAAGAGSLNITDGSVTIAGTTTIGSHGTLSVSGSSYLTTHSLDASNAASFSFNGGTITITGGQMMPRLSTLSVFNSSTPYTFYNAFDISGPTNTPAVLSFENGGTLSSGALYGLVGDSGGTGALAIDGSTSSFTLSSGILYVGEGRSAVGSTAALGLLTLSNGAHASSLYMGYIGADGGNGYGIVSGANSALSVSYGALFVGSFGYTAAATLYGGNGTLLLSSGGQSSSYSDTYIGYLLGNGNVSVDGAGSKLTSNIGSLFVGDGNYVSGNTMYFGTGTLSLTNGGQASGFSNASIGVRGGAGDVSIAGGGLSIGSVLTIGSSAGSGTMAVSGGGTITSNSGIIGASAATGNAMLSGTGTAWTNAATLSIGNDGTGAVASNGVGLLALSSNASLTNGGLLKAYSGGTLSVASGASLTTGSLDVSSAGGFAFTAGTIKINGGSFLAPSSGATIGDGNSPAALVLHNATVANGGLAIASNATLTGSGSVTTPTVVNPGGTLAPGENGPGKMNFSSGLTLTSSGSARSTLTMEIGAPTTAGSTFDQIAMTGGLFTIGSATLQLVPLTGTVLGTPYPIIVTNGGSIDHTATFSNLTAGRLYSDGGTTAVVSYQGVNTAAGTEIDVTFTSIAPEPGSMSILAIGGLALLRRRRRYA